MKMRVAIKEARNTVKKTDDQFHSKKPSQMDWTKLSNEDTYESIIVSQWDDNMGRIPKDPNVEDTPEPEV